VTHLRGDGRDGRRISGMFEAMIATVSSRPMPSFDIAIGIAAELIVTMPIGQAFANIRREFPGSDHRAIGWGFAGLDGFQHFVVTQHTGLPGVHPLNALVLTLEFHFHALAAIQPFALQMDIECGQARPTRSHDLACCK
jgi:hypothetical protein